MNSTPSPIPPTPMVYVSRDGETWGPYDTATLQSLVNERKFLPTDLANVAGSDNWQPLNTIASFPASTQEVIVHHTEKKKTGCFTWGVLIALIIGVILIIMQESPSSSSSSEGKNPVKASVHTTQYEVSVTNLDNFEWGSLQLIVNGPLGYKYKHPYSVPAGETITVELNRFAKGDKRLNPFTTKVQKVGVWVQGYDIPLFNVK